MTRNLLVPVGLIVECGRPLEFARPVATDAVLFATLIAAHRESRSPDRELQSECATFEALSALAGEQRCRDEPNAKPSRNIVRACELVRDNFTHKITLDAMAAAACLSKFHFVRAFARQVGISPHAFVVQVRLRAAVTALKSGAPVGEVAAHAGFADQSHFCRAFKRTLGVTPAAYARAAAGGSVRRSALCAHDHAMQLSALRCGESIVDRCRGDRRLTHRHADLMQSAHRVADAEQPAVWTFPYDRPRGFRLRRPRPRPMRRRVGIWVRSPSLDRGSRTCAFRRRRKRYSRGSSTGCCSDSR